MCECRRSTVEEVDFTRSGALPSEYSGSLDSKLGKGKRKTLSGLYSLKKCQGQWIVCLGLKGGHYSQPGKPER